MIFTAVRWIGRIPPRFWVQMLKGCLGTGVFVMAVVSNAENGGAMMMLGSFLASGILGSCTQGMILENQMQRKSQGLQHEPSKGHQQQRFR